MTFAAAAPYAVAAAGLAVLAAWAARVRAGRDWLGPRPAGPWPDTGFAAAVALPAWFLAPNVLVTVAGSAELSPFAVATAVGLVHTMVSLVLLPFVRRGAPVPALSGARLAAAGGAAGLVTYGVVGVVGESLRAAYGLAGAAIPEQDVVALARAASGAELTGFVLATVVLAPFAEEVFWRGALLPALLRRTSAGNAVLLQGAAFGAVHVYGAPPAQWPLALPLAVVGCLAGWLTLRTGSLAPPILLHAVFNGLHLAFLRAG